MRPEAGGSRKGTERPKPSFRRLATFNAVLLITLITLAVLFFATFRFPFTEFLELKLYDLKFHFRGPRPAGSEVALVAIDDASVKELGRWPWSREVLARLLTRLKEAEPRVVAVDIIFAEREITVGVETLKRLSQSLFRSGLLSPDIAAVIKKEEERADVDRQLAQSIAWGAPTILGFYFEDVGGQTLASKPEQFMGRKAIEASTYNLVRLLERRPPRLPLVGATGAEVNLPMMTEAAAGGGYFNMIPDPDGTVRWLPLAIVYGPDLYAPLALVTLQHFWGCPPLGITLSQTGVENIRVGAREIPVDRFGRFLINYPGPPGAFATYSAADVLAGRLPAGALKDKIALVGATATGIYDLRVTPFSGVSPGLEIQAAILDNILREDYLKAPRTSLPVLLIVVALGAILGLALVRLSAAGGFAVMLFLALGYTAANYYLFTKGWQLELIYPLMEIGAVYTGVTVLRFLAEERERLRLKKAFQSYVAPAVVEEIIRHPERLRLGGERRTITILFCDIRGFTSLSEILEPEELVEILHEFLNPMSEIIVSHGGTLDKYMGDAIMAFFGAPLEMTDHAGRACRAALEMTATLRHLGREWEARGRPRLRIGIGLNTGVVAVGNMGSDRLFDYTAIGDHVNLASRLEGLNKYYGTEILISGHTAQALDGNFILQEVDLVRVMGKTQPLEIFELLGEGTPDPKLARFLEAYHAGLRLFRARAWQESAQAFSQARRLYPENCQVQRYMELAEKFQAEPPGPDWQGITVMEGK
jgi:adenylate cyclase